MWASLSMMMSLLVSASSSGGPYNTEHVYEQQYQGTGNLLNLRYNDSHYIDNEIDATLKVAIFEMR